MIKHTIINGTTWLLNDKFQLVKKVDSVPTDSVLHKPYILIDKFVYATEGDDNVEYIAIELNEYALNILSNDIFINQFTQAKEVISDIKSYNLASNFTTKLLDWDFDAEIQANEPKIIFLSDDDTDLFSYNKYDDSLNYYDYGDLTINRLTEGFTFLYFNFYSKYTDDVIKTKLHLEEVKKLVSNLR